MPSESEGFAPEPGPELDLGLPAAEPRHDLPWPPWLENLGTIGRVRAIVAAVVACYGDARDETLHGGVGGQHCTATMATAFLLKLLAGDDGPAQTLAEASEAMLPSIDDPPGKLAHVEVKGFRDLGVVRVSESTLGGVAMLRAVDADGAVAEFPASSLHFITWLPEGATEADVRRALPAGDGFGERGEWDGTGPW